MNYKKLFFDHVAQTSPSSLAIEIERAEGIYMYSPDGKEYIDIISGVSVSNIGHSNAAVVDAVCNQAREYMHLMVYGEMVQKPQVEYAAKIASYMPKGVDSVYFVNSGSEAIEGAMKLAKRFTARGEIACFKNAYHGSSQGALSMMGGDFFSSAYRPLLPGITRLEYNNIESLELINDRMAAVFIEPIQGEGGFIRPSDEFMRALRTKCDQVGALLIYDEIQTGVGRVGKMFAWELAGVEPDIICMAKAIGGGMPLGCFAAKKEVMECFTNNPVLGHITTFGGHPVCCAAGMAAMEYIEQNDLVQKANAKGELFKQGINNPLIKCVRAHGLLVAIEFENSQVCNNFLKKMVEVGLVSESFFFCEHGLRIAPPLTITESEIEKVCKMLNSIEL